jgi:hypothetical protein
MQTHLTSGSQIATGTVIGGKIVLDGVTLPEGTPVTVLSIGPNAAVQLPSALQAELERALVEADADEGLSPEELFEQLKQYRQP